MDTQAECKGSFKENTRQDERAEGGSAGKPPKEESAGGQGLKNFADSLAFTQTQMDKFNQIENVTSIELKDMAEAFPIVAQGAAQFGLSAEQTAAALAAMHEKAIPAHEAANALKFSFASILKPTKQAKDAFSAFNVDINNVGKTGYERLNNLAGILDNIHSKYGGKQESVLISDLVGKRQGVRFTALIQSVQQAKVQIAAALAEANKQGQLLGPSNMDKILQDAGVKLPNAYTKSLIATGEFYSKTTEGQRKLAKELEKKSTTEINIKLKSPEVQFQILKQKLTNVLGDFGKALLPYVLKVGEMLVKIVDWLKNLPGPVMAIAAGFAVFMAALGPIVFLAGQMGTAFGEVANIILKIAPSMKILNLGSITWAEKIKAINGHYAKVGDNFIELKQKSRGLVETQVSGAQEIETADRKIIAVKQEIMNANQLAVDNALKGIQKEVVATQELIAVQKEAALGPVITGADAAQPFGSSKPARTMEEINAAARTATDSRPLLGPLGPTEIPKTYESRLSNSAYQQIRGTLEGAGKTSFGRGANKINIQDLMGLSPQEADRAIENSGLSRKLKDALQAPFKNKTYMADYAAELRNVLKSNHIETQATFAKTKVPWRTMLPNKAEKISIAEIIDMSPAQVEKLLKGSNLPADLKAQALAITHGEAYRPSSFRDPLREPVGELSSATGTSEGQGLLSFLTGKKRNQAIEHHSYGIGKPYVDITKSFKRKYKNYDNGDLSEAYFGSKTFLVWTTDAFHLTNTIDKAFLATGVVLNTWDLKSELKQYKKKDRWKVVVFKKILLPLIIQHLAFEMTFDNLHR